MSTRAQVIIKDAMDELHFYRHSDGYIKNGCGDDIANFVKDYTNGLMRLNAMQSAGWLVIRGHNEYLKELNMSKKTPKYITKPFISKPTKDGFSGWKVGAYEPCGPTLACDIEFIYIIDLENMTLEMRTAEWSFGAPSLDQTKLVKTIKFGVKK